MDGATWNGSKFETGPLANASPTHAIESIGADGAVSLRCGAEYVAGETNATVTKPSKRMQEFAEPVTCRECLAIMAGAPSAAEKAARAKAEASEARRQEHMQRILGAAEDARWNVSRAAWDAVGAAMLMLLMDAEVPVDVAAAAAVIRRYTRGHML